MQSEILERALGLGAAEDADAATVAAAVVCAVGSLLGELTPLVGGLAARALYARSLHLARASFRRPDSGEVETQSDLAALYQDLVCRIPVEARQAGQALLGSFVDLLVSLVGAPITHRMLRTAWGVSAAELPLRGETE